MNYPRTAIVVTTIFEPHFLEGYIENLERHGRRETTEIIVIIDRKTPGTVAARCADLAAAGWRVLCPTLEEQETFLRRFPAMAGRIPYDSDNRRNIGFLIALDRGAELLITIDDDNYCLPGSDFVGEHSVAGSVAAGHEVVSSDGWFNFCSLLDATTKDPIFPRGFPYFARHMERTISKRAVSGVRVALNVGLWLSDPDVDAISRLAQAPMIQRHTGGSLFLSESSWSPINTQNTAIARDAVPAYYYVRMGFSVGGMKIDRYGDILSGYFIQKCIKSRGEGIRVGGPIADHRRTPHNLFKDLFHELAGMVVIEELLPRLVEMRIETSEYSTMYLALADELEAAASTIRGFVWDDGGREFVKETADSMRAWTSAVRLIG